MNHIALPSEGHAYNKSPLKNEMIFHKDAVEISILDRWGRPIWTKKRGMSLEPICWNGLDCFGNKVSAGSYMCKIVYPDKLVVYLPFVFIQK